MDPRARIAQALMGRRGVGYLPGMTKEDIASTQAAQAAPVFRISPAHQAAFDEAVAAMPASTNVQNADDPEAATRWANALMGHAGPAPEMPPSQRIAEGFSMLPSSLATQAGLDSIRKTLDPTRGY